MNDNDMDNVIIDEISSITSRLFLQRIATVFDEIESIPVLNGPGLNSPELSSPDLNMFGINREELERNLIGLLLDNINSGDINFMNSVSIPDDFWEPVNVGLKHELKTETYDSVYECLICCCEKKSFKKIECCNNKICIECCSHWFEKSVYCPFCKKDLRQIFENE